ncbi:ATPase, T2SS/T4P/T4SS family [Streptomyces iranensis]|uniref:Flp pilus assembly CpaF family ATPase n=1 Tax=Streptomyces iranensis TaxID=576784 RepID=A0A060ZIG6_9ACTN|nr:Flp pilus assembly CpaF family ATPase [Streptomyces iranensis]CDR01324.1 type II secretion system protein E [Streptomyces iranensis]
MAGFVSALVRARRNIIIGGGTNVGKTTVVRAFASQIPPTERLITIEDTFELGLNTDTAAHPNVVAMQAREPNLEVKGANIPIRQLSWAFPVDGEAVGVTWCGTR